LVARYLGLKKKKLKEKWLLMYNELDAINEAPAYS
jgi:hypothetical protein